MTEPDKAEEKVVERALKRWQFSSEYESDNREQQLFALKFSAGGKDQWSETQWDLRGNNNQPRESYNQCDQFINKVCNNARMNMPQTRFIPENDASKEVAEAREDLARSLQAEIQAQIAYDTALESAVRLGEGYWRYIAVYEHEDSFDQKIEIMWCPNRFAIYDDPTCLRQDRLDRKFLFHVMDQDINDFNAENDRDYGAEQFQSIGDHLPNKTAWGEWNEKTKTGTVRIAEYWEVKTTKTKLYRTKKGMSKTKPKGEVKDEDVREVEESKVIWRKITGYEVLEEREWPGKYIPYVRIVGKEMYIDGKTRVTGLTQPMIPAQRQYNDWVNAATEMANIVPISPMIADPVQIEDFTDIWKNANIKRYSVLPYRRFINGVDYGAPQRMNNSIDLSAMVSLIQLADQNFSKVTGIYPSSLGAQSNEISGRAINARKEEGDVATYHYQDNFARGLHTGGEILDDLFTVIYDGSRTVQGLKEDNKTREIQLNQRFKDKDGKFKELDMTKGKFSVKVTTGPSYMTRRQESVDSKMQLVQAYPAIMQIAGGNIVRDFDWNGSEELADILDAMAPPQVQALKNPEVKDIPPQIQAKLAQDQEQMQQMQQMLQEIGGRLQQAEGELQSKQADVETKQIDLQLKAQQMQFDAEDAARQAQLDAERIQIDREKVHLEALKIQLETFKAQYPPETQQIQQETVQPDDPYNQQMMVEQNAELQAQKDAYEAQKNEAFLTVLAGIQQSVNNLTQQVSEPKTVIYDENGMVKGVQ